MKIKFFFYGGIAIMTSLGLIACGGDSNSENSPVNYTQAQDTNTVNADTGGSSDDSYVHNINTITIVNNTETSVCGLKVSWNLGAGLGNSSYTEKYGGWKNVSDECILPYDIITYDVQEPMPTGGLTSPSLIVLRTQILGNGGHVYTEFGTEFNIDGSSSTNDTWNIVANDLPNITINNNQIFSIVELRIEQVLDNRHILNQEPIFTRKENKLNISI